jgi:DNA-binding MarR family transcriptional regulator
MDKRKLLNDLLVELFNYILLLEEKNLKVHGMTKISITEIHIIEAISKVNVPSMSEVAQKLMVTVGTLSTSVNKLVQKGMVIATRSEIDRRVVLLSLSDKGKEALEIHNEFHEKMINKILSDTKISQDELLIDSLKNLMDFFKSLTVIEGEK